jgi:parvulin-like peptidyl-prolyl isomerase
VVADVEGTAITVADVQRLCERGGLAPKEALGRLEAEALLAAEAERRGYGSVDEVARVAEQALVQTLLERDIESEQATAAEIDAAYAKSGERFHKPERRVATHLLAVLPKDASADLDASARAFVTDALAKLQAAADPSAVLEQLQQVKAPFEVKVEVLPPAPRTGMFVPEFSAALFSLSQPGIVPEPVRTQFGWHAVWVREILPEEQVPEADAKKHLAQEIATAKRQRKLDALLKQLEQRANPSYAGTVRDLLAVLEY